MNGIQTTSTNENRLSKKVYHITSKKKTDLKSLRYATINAGQFI